MSGLRSAAVACLLLALAGAAAAGDFGRADPPLFEAPRAGQFNDTDAEGEMHDRIWRFLRPPHEFRIDRKLGTASYYMWLSRSDYASSHTRYSTIADDIEADLGTLPDTFAAICEVEDVDRQRRIAVAGLPGMEPQMAAEVAQRAGRNAEEVAQFTAGVHWRHEAYSYALDHLLVETPHGDAIAVDARLAELDRYLERAERGQFCDRAARHPPPRSRYEDAGPVDLEMPGS